MQTDKKTYKKTLNLPKTAFPMRANLVQNEPASLKRWEKLRLYDRQREKRQGSPRFVFHDGPPYANGSIHLGHLVNKVLKDLVVRSHNMLGYDTPFIPGWDCHGLPIEHKVLQEGTEARRHEGTEGAMGVRRACRKYAQKYVKVQAEQMKRLLTLGDYEHPYLTMDPAYEAAVLEVFAELVERGLVYRGLKPVHWSIDNQTALAEAELEYHEREDTSVYVLLKVADASGADLPDELRSGRDNLHLLIWTTTPWTLPANMATAAASEAEYGVYPVMFRGQPVRIVLATDLAERVFGKAQGVPNRPEPQTVVKGWQLAGLTYAHPFNGDNRTRRVVLADHVTLEDGTGLVHTATGHGTEDYLLGLREGLDIYCPVRADGTFDDTVVDWLGGKTVWEANDLVTEHLRRTGFLLHDEAYPHSYPHDWRSKTPVIFRATEQWFVGVDRSFRALANEEAASLRKQATAATDEVGFVPEWGRNRLRGMLESRPDWCLSRQRSWGLAIPVFYNGAGEPLCTRRSVLAVAQLVREKGSDVWFAAEAKDLLQYYEVENDPDAPVWAKSEIQNPQSEMRKGWDIFDVWFESGSSWHAVMGQRGHAHPRSRPATDLYMEGSDQHRGWFQSSLLPAVAITGHSPFKTVLTHGFMVDKHGQKMSKSLGNTLEVEDLLKDYGADVCRWWVSSLNTDNDIKVDEQFIKVAAEEYRKVRNTVRFMLSNLNDFDPRKDAHTFGAEDAHSLDAWALNEMGGLVRTVRGHYEALAYRRAHEALFNFCNETLSAVYLMAVKDRLYCDRADGSRRRRTQTAVHRIVDGLIRLLSPIMPHTGDEAWRVLHGEEAESVHLAELPDVEAYDDVPAAQAMGQVVAEHRDGWLRAIEQYRQQRDVENPLDLGLQLPTKVGELELGGFAAEDLADLCGLSRAELVAGLDGPAVLDLRDEPRCERSWKRDGTVKQRSDGGYLSDRDAEAVGV